MVIVQMSKAPLDFEPILNAYLIEQFEYQFKSSLQISL